MDFNSIVNNKVVLSHSLLLIIVLENKTWLENGQCAIFLWKKIAKITLYFDADAFDFALESGVSNASIAIIGPPEGGEDSENEDVNEDDLSSDWNYE